MWKVKLYKFQHLNIHDFVFSSMIKTFLIQHSLELIQKTYLKSQITLFQSFLLEDFPGDIVGEE